MNAIFLGSKSGSVPCQHLLQNPSLVLCPNHVTPAKSLISPIAKIIVEHEILTCNDVQQVKPISWAKKPRFYNKVSIF